MIVHRISAYTIEGEQGKTDLDYSEYSRFKYGHRPTAIRFAETMTEAFLREVPLERICDSSDKVIISTSPFWATPPSAYLLAVNFHYLINEMLVEVSRSPVCFMKIHRTAAPVTDFSRLSHRERLENMQQDRLSFDPFILAGKRLVVVEDARITGAHEQRTIDFMAKSGLDELYFVYAVNVSYGPQDPDIENRINHKWVNDLNALQLLMRRPDEYFLNSRVCRLVLSWENLEELEDFCKRISDEMLFSLYMACVNDGYGSIAKYAKGFRIVRREKQFRHAMLQRNGHPEAMASGQR